jgi:phosphoenolpyruvate carboxylase
VGPYGTHSSLYETGTPPDLTGLSLSRQNGKGNDGGLGHAVSRDMYENSNYAMCYTSTKHNPQRVGKEHKRIDEDVLQIITKTVNQQKHDKNYNQRCKHKGS